MQAIGQIETTLLYAMQWILLYAAEECAGDEGGLGGGGGGGLVTDGDHKGKSMEQYLFSVPTITVSL